MTKYMALLRGVNVGGKNKVNMAELKSAFDTVGEIKPEYERVGYYGNVIFWSAPSSTFSKTRWSKVVGSKIYGQITIRNANTVKKLSGWGD